MLLPVDMVYRLQRSLASRSAARPVSAQDSPAPLALSPENRLAINLSFSKNWSHKTLVLWLLVCFGVATIWVEGRWAVSVLEAGVFAMAAITLLRRSPVRAHWTMFVPLAIAAWGLIQIALHRTIATADTQWTLLYWLAAACFLGLGATVEDHERLLDGMLWFGAALSILALAQMNTSHGRILWIVPTQYQDQVFGTFPYYNNYAAFIELLLPLAFWRTLRGGRQWWVYAGVVTLMYGSVVASGSRAGIALATAELAVLLFVALWCGAKLRMLAILAGVILFAVVAGSQSVWQRFGAPDSYGMRRAFHESALAMARARPVTGFGLGTWTSAYPTYAVADFGVVANHAHSEWGQWAAEGGWGVVALMLVLFGLAVRYSARNTWAIGLVAVLLHALIDYPMVRLGLGCWWFTLFGLCAGLGLRASRRPQAERAFARGTQS